MTRTIGFDDPIPATTGIASVREPDPDEPDRITTFANGIAVDVIANDDGSVYVECYAYGQHAQVVVQHAAIDCYTTRHPNLRLMLADRED